MVTEETKQAICNAADKLWLTHGPLAREFERAISGYIGQKYGVFCNSGSSANLLALSALTAPELGERRIKPGDEVITTALNFPTTVAPIIQVGAVPVFVDVDLNLEVQSFEASDNTKAFIINHILGFPTQIRMSDDYWCIEDCCDALGTLLWTGNAGEYGDLSTFSFYPAHHITAGEGGMVCTSDPLLRRLLLSFRDWGRACWCEPGQDNACGHRYDGDYDHKYSYSHIGYNLKATELQAAIGLQQFQHIDEWAEIRQRNFERYLEHDELRKKFDLLGHYTRDVVPFGFPLLTKKDNRNALMRWLDGHGIGNRPIFGGNILRQRAFKDVKYRVVGDLHNTNLIHDRGFFTGCWHGLTVEHVDFVCEKLMEFE